MVPNPFLAKVIVKVVTSITKSAIKAYSNTLKKNNAASGKKAFKFDWNDIFKFHKLNIMNYLDKEKLKNFDKFDKYNPFKASDKDGESTSKNNAHKISQQEAQKILGFDSEAKPELKEVMEHYIYLYSKNKPETGGSAYLQAKVMNAKDMLVEQLGGTNAEMQWREVNGFLDDDNTVLDKKPETTTNTEGVETEDVILESTMTGEKKPDEEALKKQEEEEAKKEEEENKSDDSSDDEEDPKKKTDKDAKEGDKKDGLEEKLSHNKQLDGEFSKYGEDNPDQHENHDKEEHDADHEVDQLINKIEEEQDKK